MPRNDGVKVRRSILRAAEKLFSRAGFSGTSVAEIAEAAGVNKALVYYYFKSKDAIITSLFDEILEELGTHNGSGGPGSTADTGDSIDRARRKIERELNYLSGRKRIISVMLMETLMSANAGDHLFRCAEAVLERADSSPRNPEGTSHDDERLRSLTAEFFTGFLPLVGFVALRDKWCKFFACDPRKAHEYFLDAFTQSHLASQMHRRESDSDQT